MEKYFETGGNSSMESAEAQGGHLEQGVRLFVSQANEVALLAAKIPESGRQEARDKLDVIVRFMQNNLGLGALLTLASAPATFYAMDAISQAESNVLAELGVSVVGLATILSGACMSLMSLSKKIDNWADRQ
jgi:hypothetical protein